MKEPAEIARRTQRDNGEANWDLWGTYLSERQWGTVREDYSHDGNAWNHFPFDHSHSRTYRWGEDGLLGFCDDKGRICFAMALWNGEDPILKERLFGLSNPEGNHGEDVKDYMFHLAGTPTGSYSKALYKYPQQQFPYEQLREENSRRDRSQPEYELVDTGIFDENRYFDVEIEYAKAGPEDILIRITATNRGPQKADLHVLPQLWLRNTWSWGTKGQTKPSMHGADGSIVTPAIATLPPYILRCRQDAAIWFTENESNTEKLFGLPLSNPYVKDAFHRHLIEGETSAINPKSMGSKAAFYLKGSIESGENWTVDLRLSRSDITTQADVFTDEQFDQLLKQRRQEWQEYLRWVAPDLSDQDRSIHTAAGAGLYWGRQYYNWFVHRWLVGDSTGPQPAQQRWKTEQSYWRSMNASDIISMPDSWEYPYFCQWDLMFHAVAFAEYDPYEARRQAGILRTHNYTATNGQSPAYEWSLSDPNPPIGAWATLRIHQIEKKRHDQPCLYELSAAYQKLLLEYGWWANRTDVNKDGMFDGGFLGLDNIAIFDRSRRLNDGSRIQQPDGTSWMAMYSLNMLELAVEIGKKHKGYSDSIGRFIKDFWKLTYSLNANDGRNYVCWDEQDGFYYDVLDRVDGSADYLRTRSLAGLIPLLAVASFDRSTVNQFPMLDIQPILQQRAIDRGEPFPELDYLGEWHNDRILYALVPKSRLIRILERVFDEAEFLSPYGIRGLSKHYENNPYTYREGDEEGSISYSPADSPVPMFGGNSNWRGPVWMPINYLIIEALQKYARYYGDDLKMEFPTGSGNLMNLWEISLELEERLINIFRCNETGSRPFNGSIDYFNQDQHWKDLIRFNEYFHGDNGSGLGASHQTGWTAIVSKMINQLNRYR